MSDWDSYMTKMLANSRTSGYTGSLFTGYRGDESGKGAESTYGNNTFDDPTDKGEFTKLLTGIGNDVAYVDGGRIKGVDGPELHKDSKGYFTHMSDGVHGGAITVRLKADASGKLSLDGDPAQAVQYESGKGGWLDKNLGVSGEDLAKAAVVAAAIYTGGAAMGAWGGEAAAAGAAEVGGAMSADEFAALAAQGGDVAAGMSADEFALSAAGNAGGSAAGNVAVSTGSTAVAGATKTAASLGTKLFGAGSTIGGVLDGVSTFAESGLGRTILGAVGGAYTAEKLSEATDKKIGSDEKIAANHDQTSITTTGMNNDATRYVSDNSLTGTKYVADTNAQSALDQIKTKDQLDREKMETSRKSMTAGLGLSNDQYVGNTAALTRPDGTPLYNPDGTLASPFKGIINGARG